MKKRKKRRKNRKCNIQPCALHLSPASFGLKQVKLATAGLLHQQVSLQGEDVRVLGSVRKKKQKRKEKKNQTPEFLSPTQY